MKFRIEYEENGFTQKIDCDKNTVLRTAELKLRATTEDVISLISFMEIGKPGGKIKLSIGMVYKM